MEIPNYEAECGPGTSKISSRLGNETNERLAPRDHFKLVTVRATRGYTSTSCPVFTFWRFRKGVVFAQNISCEKNIYLNDVYLIQGRKKRNCVAVPMTKCHRSGGRPADNIALAPRFISVRESSWKV